MFLHETAEFSHLIAIVGREHRIVPALIEKDYWIMHCLWGLKQAGFTFELKGGTSLSKGFGIINRFSEDIDIRIAPPNDLPIGKNHTKPRHIEARQNFFDQLATQITIDGITSVDRDIEFDDKPRMRNAGIRLQYEHKNPIPSGVKHGVLLEAGFDQVTPNRNCDISSWVYDHAAKSDISDLIDNRALGVPCYEPGYTLVEKLQTISTKFRQQQKTGALPQNFMRHYYDVYCLLQDRKVQDFIGTVEYLAHKENRFRAGDDKDITRNEAFVLSDPNVHKLYSDAYDAPTALYYRSKPSFSEVLAIIQTDSARL
ncbi:MAG: nucleotidyl transferase AbiEii/AbiGii toxin family protein [Sphingomonadales bacterium]|nr:nucleotidyl transferase AbiEii/AbiGii toxin family protein [Sphingomonadales bacterium]